MVNRKSKEGAGAGRWLEIVNWRKAQPKMRGRGNTWCKVYTSLLDHEGFEGLDDTSRVLILALWLYAARSGRHVFPSDPKWIAKRIPMLNSPPDFGPLLDARDAVGRPEPFLRYCEAPAAEEPEAEAKAKAKPKATGGAKRGRKPKTEKREEKRREQKRAEQTRDPNPNGFGKEEREKKRRVSSKPRAQKATPEQTRPDEGQKPANPKESEVGEAPAAALPRGTPPHSAPMRLGNVMKYLYWRDEDCVAFGYEVFRLLGLDKRYGPETEEGKADRGTFTKWLYVHGRTGDFEAARARGLAKAAYIRKYCRRPVRPGALWLDIMNGKCQAPRSPRSPPATAVG